MVSGHEWFASIPSDVAGREAATLAAVQAGQYVAIDWYPIVRTLTYQGRQVTATVFVAADALRIGSSLDALRMSLTPRTSQKIADLLGCYLMTPYLCDCVRDVAVANRCLVEPQTQPASPAERARIHYSPSMSDNAAIALHSRRVDSLRTDRLVCNAGKDWVLTNTYASHPKSAANYGWFSSRAAYSNRKGMRMWQTLGFAHNADHVDYSQTLRLVRSHVSVDGVDMPFADVARDPALCGLVSDEGPLKYLRIPCAEKA